MDFWIRFYQTIGLGTIILVFGICNLRRKATTRVSVNTIFLVVIGPIIAPIAAVILFDPSSWGMFANPLGAAMLLFFLGTMALLVWMPKGMGWTGVTDRGFREALESGLNAIGEPFQPAKKGLFLVDRSKLLKVRYGGIRKVGGLDNLNKVLPSPERKRLVEEMDRHIAAANYEVPLGLFKMQIVLGIVFIGFGSARFYYDF